MVHPYKLIIRIGKYPANGISFPGECHFYFCKKLPFSKLKLLIAWADNYHLVDWGDYEFVPF
jgi:hypothetical protein